MSEFFGRTVAETGIGKLIELGSILPFDAYDGRGFILLKAGGMVTSRSQLQRLLEPDVRIGHYFPLAMQAFIGSRSEILSRETLVEEDNFEERTERASELKCELVQDVSNLFERIEGGGDVDVNTARDVVSKLAGEMADNKYAVVSLAKLKDADAYTYTHSVNVSIFAMYIAMNSDYACIANDIGVGALLHDIGKVVVPLDVLHKAAPLNCSDWKVLHRHPLHGAQLLFLSGYKDDAVLACVLDHHEKLTGVGYPHGKSAAQLPPFGRIVAIADIYDALTTDRPYRAAMTPEQALRVMVHDMAGELDSRLLKIFIEAIGQAYKYESEATGEPMPSITAFADVHMPTPPSDTMRAYRRLDCMV